MKNELNEKQLDKIKGGNDFLLESESTQITKESLPDFQISKVDLPKYGVLMDEVAENTDGDIIIRLSDGLDQA